MSNNDALLTLREFFSDVGFAGLILPSGWFGRTYDNQLQLTRSEASEGSLLIELVNQLVLTFCGEPQVTTTDRGLRLSGFTALAWDWIGFGSTASHHEDFVAGEVELVASLS